MRKLTVGVAVSTALHAAAVIAVSTRERATLAAIPASAPPIEVSVIAPEPPSPLEAVLLEDRPPMPGPPTAPPRSLRPASPASATAQSPPRAGAAIAVPGAPDGVGTPPPPASGALSMRRGEAPRLELPSGRWDALDHAPAGTRPAKQRVTGILHESGRGTYATDQGGFTGKVNPDGTIQLRDKPSASIHIALPSPKDVGRAIATWYDAEKGTFGETVEAPLSKHLQVAAGTTTDPGDEAHPEHALKDHATTVIVPILGGGIEITDWLMRRKGIDPYASRKLKLLDATRDERVELGNRHRTQQLALTPQIVRRNLEALWARISGPGARKQALFELWDECAETGDPAVVAGGEAARTLVIGFIRAHLPAGSADAYTAAELEALARSKRSKAVFAPYE